MELRTTATTTSDRATARKAELVRSIEQRLCAADDPLYVRHTGGTAWIGHSTGGRLVLWAPVEFLSTCLLRRGYGKRPDDDIPF